MNTAMPFYFNVFTVEEFDAPTSDDIGRKARSWTNVGIAFPHKDGTGYNVQLRSLPLDGKLVILPAQAGEDSDSWAPGRHATLPSRAPRALRQ